MYPWVPIPNFTARVIAWQRVPRYLLTPLDSGVTRGQGRAAAPSAGQKGGAKFKVGKNDDLWLVNDFKKRSSEMFLRNLRNKGLCRVSWKVGKKRRFKKVIRIFE